MKEGTLIRKEDIIKKNKQVSSVINNVPTLEREYVEGAREQEIKRNIYLFLLQKREETQLALSSSTSTIKIADYAYTTEKPTSPNKKLTLVTAMFCTIILGFIYIYVSSVITSYNDKKKKKTN